MNPVEIEEAVSALAQAPFDRAEFPFQFLAAFGNKETTLSRLRAGNTNQSDIPGAVLQRGHIHLMGCEPGGVDDAVRSLRESPKTTAQKAKFILATDGESFQAEDLTSGGTIACTFAEFPDHFGFFLPLAGITTVEQIRESSFDIKATGRLNRLYIELLRENPEWQNRREDMNHFMARLIFCFFAEDTDIFLGDGLFSKTVEQMSARDASDTHLVISEIFRAMDTRIADRDSAGIKRYANQFPYVNGALFSGSTECPRFSKIGRSYLLHIASLNWKKINPDIFGSMIQAVADDEERGSLGMHYTSVPNILKVLNPLFLDDLRDKLAEAGDNGRKLLNLRNRIAKIRVFDPACGSGNFLVIAYKEMRAIEAEINKRRGEPDRRTDIPLTNFRGIELRDFPAEIARLALIIAEFQCDVLYRGQKEALAEFLPLDNQNWITCGNALQLDWLSICPPTGAGVRVQANDLFSTPLDQAEIDFENEGGETYICGNPPYLGSVNQNEMQKIDMRHLLDRRLPSYRDLDYVACWFVKASDFIKMSEGKAAFVSTCAITQGEMVPMLWPYILTDGVEIFFAHRQFGWSNSAKDNAGVICVIVGIAINPRTKHIYFDENKWSAENISPYLVDSDLISVEKATYPISQLPKISTGNIPSDGGNLIFTVEQARKILESSDQYRPYFRRFLGSQEIIHGGDRRCLWFDEKFDWQSIDDELIAQRLLSVKQMRERSKGGQTRSGIDRPHRFVYVTADGTRSIAIPKVFSYKRDYLTCVFVDESTIVSDLAKVVYKAESWNFSILSSRLQMVWVATVCGQLGTSLRYSHTLGWNAFPMPVLTDQNKADLSRCAEDILLVREAHFPATIADLYDPEAMPDDLRAAHDRNDETLERIYIGRRFRNDTERLEKLFELYTKMTKGKGARAA